MFGDLFYQRTDDESGLLYSSRRRFLGVGKNTFEPPPEFQTRRLARRRHIQSLDSTLSVANFDDETSLDSVSTDADISNLLSGKKKESVITGISLPTLAQPSKRYSMEENAAAKKFRKTAKFVMETVLLETDVNVEDWREETAAGVHYWVNNETGDVVTECPWGKEPPKRFSFKAHASKIMRKEPEEDEEEDQPEGTGSLVFKQGRDVDELFKLIDSVKL